jgi:hypothetical protein
VQEVRLFTSFAFVRFQSKSAAVAALTNRRHTLGGRAINVDACTRNRQGTNAVGKRIVAVESSAKKSKKVVLQGVHAKPPETESDAEKANEGGASITDSFVFMSSSATFEECIAKGLFGSPKGSLKEMQDRIKPSTALFLINFTTNELHGVFHAVGEPSLDIVPTAWARTGRGRRFPAQARVTRSKVLKVMIDKGLHSKGKPCGPGYHDCEDTKEMLKKLGY